MLFIEAMENGSVPGFGKADNIIDTVLSRVFFFGERVIKVYKHEGDFRSLRSEFAFRKEFYAEDFFWNHETSPEIYRKLVGVKERDGLFEIVSLDEAEDFFIEMKAVEAHNNITNLLADNKLSGDDIEAIAISYVEKLRLLTKDRKEKLSHLFEMSWLERHHQHLEYLREWGLAAPEYISVDAINELIDTLQQAAAGDPYFINFNPDFLSVAIDNNPDNFLYIEGKPVFIDIMPAREEWKVSDEFFSFAGTAVSVRVLGSEALSQRMYEAYKRYRLDLPQKARLIYESRSALISFLYRHMTGKHELGERFREALEDNMSALKKLL